MMIATALATYPARAYEVSFANDTSATVSIVRKIPISHNLDGIVANGDILFERESIPDKLEIGDINNLGKAKLSFQGGRLICFERDGSDVERESDKRFLTAQPGNMAELWRKKADGDEGAWKYWDKSNRLRLWFFNPNGAGTLFAEISLALFVLAILVLHRKVIRAILLAGAGITVAFLLATGSRGSLIALVASVIVASTAVLRDLKPKTIVICTLSAIAIVGVAIGCLGGDRFGKHLIAMDDGNMQRVRAWRAAPAMMAAAPAGWGEKPGYAYNEWFQAEKDTHVLDYLVNTHLTWMAGKGWAFSFFYSLGWALLFSLLLACRGRYCAASLAMWTLFFIANWFSTLGFFVSLWIIPAIFTIPAAIEMAKRFKAAKMRYLVAGLSSPAIALGVVWGAIAVGKADLAKMDVPVRNDGKAVYVGTGEPISYIVPDYWVLCRYRIGGMGRDIRAWCRAHKGEGSIAIVESIDELPPKTDRIVLVGRSCREFMSKARKSAKSKSIESLPKAKEIVFIAPNLTIRKLPEKLLKALRVRIYTGEFLAEVTGDLGLRRPWLEIVRGCELYLPNWVELATKGDGR